MLYEFLLLILSSQSLIISDSDLEAEVDSMKRRMIGTFLIIMSLIIVSVSALVYEQASNTVTQTIVDVATITLNQGTLGNLEEGQTILYTASNTSSLNDIIGLTTSKANVYLHFDTDLDGQSSNYATYQIVVKVGDTVPGGSSNSTGDTTATLTVASPDTTSGVALDAAGDWTFDFEITTTASSVSSDQPTTVNITVSAESTT